jgi:hypothetical protein
MIKVELLKDFATKKKGDVIEVDAQIASGLLKRKVAKIPGAAKPSKSKAKPKAKTTKPKTTK